LTIKQNKDENDNRFALSGLRGELLEKERERDREQQIKNEIEINTHLLLK
jgi:hypothetical protein